MRVGEVFESYQKLAEPVARPNNQLNSLSQVARKAHWNDDGARRLLDQLAADVNHPLIFTQDRRLMLTDAGRQLLEVAVKFLAIRENGETPPDVLTVEADPAVAECLLPLALPEFFSLVGSLVQLRIYPLNVDLIRSNIQSGATTFGVGFADDTDVVSTSETLPKIPWVVLVGSGHRLASHGPINGEALTVNDRIFLPEMASKWPGMDKFLKAVPLYNRIECDGTVAIRLALSGLGAAVVTDLLPEHHALCKRVIQDVRSCQLRLFLPKKGLDGLNDVEISLVENLQKAAEVRCKQEAPPVEAAVEVVEEDSLFREFGRHTEGALS